MIRPWRIHGASRMILLPMRLEPDDAAREAAGRALHWQEQADSLVFGAGKTARKQDPRPAVAPDDAHQDQAPPRLVASPEAAVMQDGMSVSRTAMLTGSRANARRMLVGSSSPVFHPRLKGTSRAGDRANLDHSGVAARLDTNGLPYSSSMRSRANA